MFFLIEQVVAVVVALVVLVTLAIVAMIVIAIQRRQLREKYFERLDRLRTEYAPLIAGILDGNRDYERVLARLRMIGGRDRLAMLERLCLEKKPTSDQLPTLRRLCEDLGLVELWQQHLSQRSGKAFRAPLFSAEGVVQRLGRLEFLTRAQSAENLGLIGHQPSWPLLVEALKDPHPDVQAVTVRALDMIGEPKSFPALVERLQAVVLDPATRVSLRAVKTALVSFPLSVVPHLLSSLGHSHRRVRFLATDVIREMVEREAAREQSFALTTKLFPPELTDIFLRKLCGDENPDVRARAAPVISYLADPQAAKVLVAGLEDPEWFVRLHVVRALAKPRFKPQTEALARCLSDPYWMVREATVKTLLALQGLDHLCQVFLRTQDRYSREQIADEWQRTGLIHVLVTQYAQSDNGQEKQILAQLANMGKTSYMLAVVHYSPDRELRKKFLNEFGRHPDPQIQAWVSGLALRETDTELRALARAQRPPAMH